MSYLLATSDFSIKGRFGDIGDDTMVTYSDSDLAGNPQLTTRSQTGTMIFLNRVPIAWRSRVQCKTSKSIAQAEIYAMSNSLSLAYRPWPASKPSR